MSTSFPVPSGSGHHEGGTFVDGRRSTCTSEHGSLIDDGMRCLTYHLSEWSQHRLQIQRLLLPRGCMQGFVRRYNLNRLPMMCTLAFRMKILPIVNKALQNHRKQAQYVLFLVNMWHVMMAHFLLGSTSEGCVSSLHRGGASYSAPTFPTFISRDSQ